MTTTVRLPPRVEQSLAEYCVAHHKTKSEVIVESLENHLGAAVTARKTPYELALEVGFIGCATEGIRRGPNLKAQVEAAIRAKHKR
jgi:predicted DNA-binding protein